LLLGILQLIECIISIFLDNTILNGANQLDEDIILQRKSMPSIVSTRNKYHIKLFSISIHL